jgi:hypothetical protein
MELHTTERNVQIFGQCLEKRAAQIELNPIIFEILSGKIYSNKILAVIRELSCNAVDAHRMTDRQGMNSTTAPFDVQLPSELEPIFRIRDYGPGLSHEDIFNLYMTFGASSKRASNALIGGLGIGSKAPFAYTSCFTVTSYHGGKVNSYQMFIDDDGKPCTMHVSETVDVGNAPTGLEITVPVKRQDISRFVNEAENCYRWFTEVKPNFTGVKPNVSEAKIAFDGRDKGINFLIQEANRYYSGSSYVVMGNIAYSINNNELYEALDKLELGRIMNNGSVFFAPIGALDIAASRETLSFNKRTIINLVELIKTELTKTADFILNEINSFEGNLAKIAKFVTSNELINFCEYITNSKIFDPKSSQNTVLNLIKTSRLASVLTEEEITNNSNLKLLSDIDENNTKYLTNPQITLWENDSLFKTTPMRYNTSSSIDRLDTFGYLKHLYAVILIDESDVNFTGMRAHKILKTVMFNNYNTTDINKILDDGTIGVIRYSTEEEKELVNRSLNDEVKGFGAFVKEGMLKVFKTSEIVLHESFTPLPRDPNQQKFVNRTVQKASFQLGTFKPSYFGVDISSKEVESKDLDKSLKELMTEEENNDKNVKVVYIVSNQRQLMFNNSNAYFKRENFIYPLLLSCGYTLRNFLVIPKSRLTKGIENHPKLVRIEDFLKEHKKTFLLNNLKITNFHNLLRKTSLNKRETLESLVFASKSLEEIRKKETNEIKTLHSFAKDGQGGIGFFLTNDEIFLYKLVFRTNFDTTAFLSYLGSCNVFDKGLEDFNSKYTDGIISYFEKEIKVIKQYVEKYPLFFLSYNSGRLTPSNINNNLFDNEHIADWSKGSSEYINTIDNLK